MKDFLAHFKSTPGAISVTEAIALYKLIHRYFMIPFVPEDEIFLDFGSHAGKSSMTAITSLSECGLHGKFYMIDPAYNINIPFRNGWGVFKGDDYRERIASSVVEFSKNIEPVLIGATSAEAVELLKDLDRIAYAFIDSDTHDDDLLNIECAFLKDRMREGGLIVFHDYKNQYTAPIRAVQKLVESNKYEEIQIDWGPIIKVVDQFKLEQGNDSWHWNTHPHPNFIGAVVRKDKS